MLHPHAGALAYDLDVIEYVALEEPANNAPYSALQPAKFADVFTVLLDEKLDSLGDVFYRFGETPVADHASMA